MANRLIVEIAGDTRPLDRALGRTDRKMEGFARKSNRLGQRMRRGGMFAAAGLSAIGFSGYVDDAAATVLEHFGVGGDAANAVADMALGMGDLAGQTGKLNAKLLGKAGLVGAAGLAAYQLTSMFLKATGLDKKLKDLGGTVESFAEKLGLIKDPMAKFEGKAAPTQAQAIMLRNQARTLRNSGLTTAQTVERLVQTNPKFSRFDIEVLAGARGKPIEVTVNLDGQVIAKNTTTRQKRAGSRTANQTSGRRG